MISTYFIKTNEEGYITDISKYGDNIPGYVAKTVDDALIPVKIMRGYYKWANDSFEVDPVKESEIDAIYDTLPEE